MPVKKPPAPPHRPLPPPDGLSPAGADLWTGLAADLAAAQGAVADVDLVLLEMLVRQADRLTEVRVSVASEGVTVVGSKGQVRPNPLLGVAAQLERDVASGLERLRLTPRLRWGVTISPEGRLVRPVR